MADLFATDFSEFTAHLWDWAPGTPGNPQWPNGGYYSATGFLGPDVLYYAEGGDIVANAGKGGSKNALWFVASASPDYEPSASRFGFQLTGDAHDPALVPVEYQAGAQVSFSLKYDASAFADTEYYGFADTILLMMVESGSGYHIQLQLIDDPGGGSDDWTLWLSWEQWLGATTPSNNAVSVHIGSKTNLLDGLWHDFVIRYKPSTITSWDPSPGTGGVDEAADGLIVVTDNGAVVFNEQNVKLTINGYGFGENGANPKLLTNVNRPEWIFVGAGMPGPYDMISFGPLPTASPSPSRSPSSSRSRSLSPSPSVSPAPAPESVSSHPLVWVEWDPGDGFVHASAEVTLPDPAGYYGGLKRARLLSVSDIRRALSGPHGDYESGRFDVTLADTDRAVRTLLGSAPTSYWTRRPMRVQLIDDEGRRLLRTPRTIAVGIVESPTFTDSEVTLRVVDAVGAQKWTEGTNG